LPRKGEHWSEEAKKSLSDAKKGKKLSTERRIKFLEVRRKYYEEFFKAYGHHPNKGRHPVTEFKKGNTLWGGRHHTPESKRKLSLALKGRLQSAETRAKKSKAHMGLSSWIKGLTKETSPILAKIGEASRKRWTPEKRRALSERNTKFWKEWWPRHPEARATMTSVSRPTSIELLARASIERRGIPMIVSKRLEDVCYPDVILPTLRIAVFCHGCFWHACPKHNPVVPDWLRAKIKDEFVNRELERRGWKVLIAWEHEFKTNKDIVGEKLDLMLASASGGE
jgi:DNA mismatch endonuclease, patch repair protein